MEHTFLQKLVLTVLAGFVAAGIYVFVYEGLIVGSMQSVNGGHAAPGAVSTPRPTPRRF